MRPNDSLRLGAALAEEQPLQIVGAINAYSAVLAERAGFRALYVSGAGVANASFGMPDLGMTNVSDVCEDVRRIARATRLPILVDMDAGWGSPLNVARAVEDLSAAGAAAVHIEDQIQAKRCGHRPRKTLVPVEEMRERLEAAAEARRDADLAIMARTDAVAVEGLGPAIERARAYVEAGAEMIFAEALGSLEEMRVFAAELDAPVLINMTEFGKTPCLSRAELRDAGIAMVLYPLSAFRAMSRAAEGVYRALRADGHQRAVIDQMQTREELYEALRYRDYEDALDRALERREMAR